MNASYHQVLIEKNDVWKTTLTSKEGLFKWLITPFILNNYLATFMQMMDDISLPFTKSFVILYLNDIPIFNKT
jgi:hypothetical protein